MFKERKSKDLAYYLNLPYTISIQSYPDGGYFAEVKELPGCMTEADTKEELWEMIEEAKKIWIETALEEKVKIPEPEKERKEV